MQKKLVTLSKAQLKKQLATASRSLVNLSKQLEKISVHVDKLQAAEAVAKKKTVAKKKPVVRKKAVVKKPAAAKGVTVLGSIFDAIKRSKKGVAIEKIKEKTGYDGRQLSNALYKLTKQGKIKTVSRGVYLKK